MLALLLLAATAAPQRTPLGQYGRWGAFRETAPLACFAIAEPAGKPDGRSRPYAAVTSRPHDRIAAQFHVRLRESWPGQTVRARIGDQAFDLLGGAAEAWAKDARDDVRIVAAIRHAGQMTIEARAVNGRHYSDRYPLNGAATAIDAAALGCLG